MAKVIMGAEAAARMSDEYASGADDEALDKCERAIKAACTKGKRTAYINSSEMTSGAVRVLKNVGYNIGYNQQDDEYIINW